MQLGHEEGLSEQEGAGGGHPHRRDSERLFGWRVVAGQCQDSSWLLGQLWRGWTRTHRLRGLSETSHFISSLSLVLWT